MAQRIARITVDGNPSVRVDFALDGGGLPGSDATVARVVNAIGAVCAATPGVHSALDLSRRCPSSHDRNQLTVGGPHPRVHMARVRPTVIPARLGRQSGVPMFDAGPGNNSTHEDTR